MEEMTEKVFEMYQQYPFPGDIEYKMLYGLSLQQFFIKAAPPGKRSFLEGVDIIEAGCGTGNTLVKMAQMFPASTFTGVDMTVNSLAIARENAAKKGLKNINFLQKDILALDITKKFDVVFCIGVLHHLADMEKGFANIAGLMKDTGYLVLWLYGTYGRFRLNLNQKMLSILFQDTPSLPERVELTKTILNKAPVQYMECHFNVPDSRIENKWDQAQAFVLNNDAWLVDQFLHCNEKTVSMREILALGKDMELVHWGGVSLDIRQYINDEQIVQIYNKLPHRDKLLVLDYFLKPNYYLMILKGRC